MIEKAENTFIVPTIFFHPHLESCLKSIHDHNENFRLIHIDQSNDPKVEALGKKYAHLYIKSYRNLGFAKAMNTGIKLADTPYVTLCNDDVDFISKRWFIDLKKILDKKKTAKPEEYEFLAINTASIKCLGHPECDLGPYQEQYSDEDYDKLLVPRKGYHPDHIFEGSMMFCTVFHKSAFDIVGLLDEGYFPGGAEDYDWCRRCYQAGYRYVSYNKALTYHHWMTSRNHVRPSEEDYAKYQKWGSGADKWGYGEGDTDIYGRKGGKKDIPTIEMPL